MQGRSTEKRPHGKGLHETKHRRVCMTVWYSVLHMLVDGACALAMFGRFLPQKEGYLYILLYNFCAFALQMPFGVVLDALNGRNSGRQDYAFYTAAIGVFCTVLGAFVHPVLLGIGNALFHVGGGVGVIREDMASGLSAYLSGGQDSTRYAADSTLPVNGRHGRSRYGQGRGLGIFVAPGALGLYLGTLAAKGGIWKAGFLCVSAFMLLLCMILWKTGRGEGKGAAEAAQIAAAGGRDGKPEEMRRGGRESLGLWTECRKTSAVHRENIGQEGGAGRTGQSKERRADADSRGENLQEHRNVVSGKGSLVLCCVLVVVLRSCIGMTAGFSWKRGILAGALATIALVGGKMAGGYAAAGFGVPRTAAVSLALAAVCYLFSQWMPVGLAAVFLFNMTMPITLYWMVCHMPDQPGFAFGILTFALFLGFLPSYLGLAPVQDGRAIGCVGSLLSLVLLAAVMGGRRGWRDT